MILILSTVPQDTQTFRSPWPWAMIIRILNSAHNPKRRDIRDHKKPQQRAGPCSKAFSERSVSVCTYVLGSPRVCVFSFQRRSLIGPRSPSGTSFLSRWTRGGTAGGEQPSEFRQACSSLRVCRLQGEAQGLPAPAASASELACPGLPTPNLTTESGNRLNPKF